MIWVALGAIGLALLLVAAVVVGFVGFVFAPHRVPPTRKQYLVLGVTGFLTLFMAPPLSHSGGGWWAVPLVMWVVLLVIIRNSAPIREMPWQREAREASERKCAIQQQRALELERVNALGKDGAKLIERATTAIAAVMSTEAARDGWLGEPADLDFSADLAAIDDALRQARRIEKLVAESKALPAPTDDDTSMLQDGQITIKRLRDDVLRRVEALDDCAHQARQVDRSLAAEREQARVEARRDATRSQLAAELYGAAAAPPDPASEAADSVTARIAAFRELKGVIDEPRQPAARVAPPPPPQNVLSWLRRLTQP
ncbi:hypothetical protein [[Mycobacterium] crassicus]|uniref:Uncharacterized protein n=1 Tax=[Mycobacterium] crassicus TaxID=2872309 RepID=A0ABU5XPA2_9MYCO|nr:hypothetical protein [Mycolicibacter sp. MYC098]MEB3022901.1 hypothetical protein [Mycolicibacter sp. MYC098]